MDSVSCVNSVDRKSKVRRWIFIGVILVIAALAIAGIVSGFKAMSAQAATTSVGVIVNGDMSEYSFNWLALQGLARAESELMVAGTVYSSTDPADIDLDVEQCALDGNELCIGVSFATMEAILNYANIYTTTKFAAIDGAYETYPPNLLSIVFSSDQVSYLAGTLAGMMSESNTIGDLGGEDIPPVNDFIYGYANGARCANPGITTIISYTNAFTDPELGAEIAQDMISQGADVIFAPAGSSGVGAILTTTQSGVWAIGVDTDQFLTVFMSGTVPGSEFLLTSAMKRLDNSVFNTISDTVGGAFTPGLVVYDLAESGVQLAPFHEAEPSIPPAVIDRLGWVTRALNGGVIDPLNPEGPCLVVHQQFLPLTKK